MRYDRRWNEGQVPGNHNKPIPQQPEAAGDRRLERAGRDQYRNRRRESNGHGNREHQRSQRDITDIGYRFAKELVGRQMDIRLVAAVAAGNIKTFAMTQRTNGKRRRWLTESQKKLAYCPHTSGNDQELLPESSRSAVAMTIRPTIKKAAR